MIKQKLERLKEVYEHLRRHYDVHTQIDFAKSIGLTRPALSSAMNGNESYLTDNLFKKICAAYQGVFNLDYLLTGEGELLEKEQYPNTHDEIPYQPTIDQSSLVNAVIASKDETIASLNARLREKDERIAELKSSLQEKDERIAELKARIQEQKRIIDSRDVYNNYPFPIGAAEDNQNKKHI